MVSFFELTDIVNNFFFICWHHRERYWIESSRQWYCIKVVILSFIVKVNFLNSLFVSNDDDSFITIVLFLPLLTVAFLFVVGLAIWLIWYYYFQRHFSLSRGKNTSFFIRRKTIQSSLCCVLANILLLFWIKIKHKGPAGVHRKIRRCSNKKIITGTSPVTTTHILYLVKDRNSTCQIGDEDYENRIGLGRGWSAC